MMVKKTVVLLVFMTVCIGTVSLAQAQVEEVKIVVDGLACPFCAYGLEKKLKKVQGVGEVKIYVEKGLANLTQDKNRSIMYEEVGSAVKDAGFTPGDIKATVVGKVSRKDGAFVLTVGPSNLELLLKDDDKLAALRSALKGVAWPVRLKGRLVDESRDGKDSHQYTLAIEDFEALK